MKKQELTIWEDTKQLAEIKEIYGKNLSEPEFKILMQIGQATNLNPFLKEIWAVKYGTSPASIFIARDGYRKSAQAHVEYDYHQVEAIYSNDDYSVIAGEVHHVFAKDRGALVGAYCIAKRKGSSKPNYCRVELNEYTTKKSLWITKPVTMIKKVAEAQALKMTWQELFAGTYDEAEDWHDDEEKAAAEGRTEGTVTVEPPAKPRAERKSRAKAVTPAPEKAEITKEKWALTKKYVMQELDNGKHIKEIAADIMTKYTVTKTMLTEINNWFSDWRKSLEGELNAGIKANWTPPAPEDMPNNDAPEEKIEMISRTQQIQIKSLQRLRNVSEEEYRSLLAGFQTETSSSLTKIEADAILSQLNKL